MMMDGFEKEFTKGLLLFGAGCFGLGVVLTLAAPLVWNFIKPFIHTWTS